MESQAAALKSDGINMHKHKKRLFPDFLPIYFIFILYPHCLGKLGVHT